MTIRSQHKPSGLHFSEMHFSWAFNHPHYLCGVIKIMPRQGIYMKIADNHKLADKGMPQVPSAFSVAYPDASYEVINRTNYLPFCL